MEIKNIETLYDGYRFRSRLEARWAVFFNEANIMYEYEPEGFKFDKVCYLPDFYLPEFKVYVEIKPTGEIAEGNCTKWESLCAQFRDLTGRAILLCYGDPAERGFSHKLFAFDMCDSSAGTSDYYCGFATCDYRTVLVVEPQRADREIFVISNGEYHESPMVKPANQFEGIDTSDLWKLAVNDIDLGRLIDDITTDASLKARRVRFEHGENPRRR